MKTIIRFFQLDYNPNDSDEFHVLIFSVKVFSFIVTAYIISSIVLYILKG